MLEQIEKSPARVIRLLLIEDHKLTRIGLTALLEDTDHIEIVGEADNAEEGTEKAFALKPDIVLMDLGLPGINGIQATQKIKKADENMKVIIYTSHEGGEEVIAALGAGADAYCVKGNNPDSLVTTIQVVADGGAWLDPSIASIALEIFRKPAYSLDTPLDETRPQAKLTERELEVLKLIVQGKTNVEIAEELIISVHTAKEHVCNILRKLSVHDRVQATVKAIQHGLL